MDTTLVIMAAGMGSRFGGLKQIAPIGPNGEVILDFSIFDAREAGFNKAVFIIKKAIEKDFRECVGKRIEKMIDVSYVFQETDKIPEEFSDLAGREKPWGTGHAILCAKDSVTTPFAVINADDFYGPSVYSDIHNQLLNGEDMCMAGYKLGNTLSENGTVSRGVCEIENGYLKSVTEMTDIPYNTDMPKDTVVSMNLWGFKQNVLDIFEEEFVKFLSSDDTSLKREFFIPKIVDTLINEKNYRFKVLDTNEKWYGITYKEDLPLIRSAIKKFTDDGLYK